MSFHHIKILQLHQFKLAGTRQNLMNGWLQRQCWTALLLGVVWFWTLDARAERAAGGIQYTSYVYVVEVPLIVWNDAQQIILDLTESDFRLKEDGVAIEQLTLTPQPFEDVWIVILLDCSNSTKVFLPAMQAAAAELVRLLPKYSKICLIEFQDRPTELTDFTMDTKQLEKLIYATKPAGTTDLAAGLALGLEKTLDKIGTRAIFLVSDGVDKRCENEPNGVPLEIKDLQGIINKRDIPIYALAQGYPINKTLLKTVCQAGDGYLLHLSDGKIKQELRNIICELIPTHKLSYQTPNTTIDGQWRRIELTCSKPGAAFAFKRGYYVNLEELVDLSKPH